MRNKSNTTKVTVASVGTTLAGLAEHVRKAATGPHVYGILHAGVTVRNFEDAVAWWSRFGFLLVTEQTISGVDADALAPLYGAEGLTVRLGFLRAPGGSVLEIFQFDPPLAPERTDWRRPGYTHVALSVRDVPGFVRQLHDEGVRMITPIQFTGGAHWVFFRDPDDNLVELIDIHANRLPLRYLGGLLGNHYRHGKWASYYL